MKFLSRLLSLLLLCGPAARAGNGPWLFCTFKDPDNAGLFFCLSDDGLKWDQLNHGQPVVRAAPGQRTRDPFLIRDPGGRGFHLLWTSNHRPRSIGYAHSADLVHWTEPRPLQVFPDDMTVSNVWAPEGAWDEIRREWIIFWSSTLPGRFTETDGQVKNNKNHRIWAVTTRDFQTVSAPFLFFDPGYPVIDATVDRQPDGTWLMIFKDEREIPVVRKTLLAATGPTPRGPWSVQGAAFTAAWTEGPSLLLRGPELTVYYDTYKPVQHMTVAVRRAGNAWKDITDRCAFPAGVKHGSFLALSAAEAARLQAAFGGK